MDAATASLGFSTKKNPDWFDSAATMLPSSSYFQKKMLLMLPSLKICHPLHCTRNGKNFVHMRRRSSARLKTNGGLTKPMKYNSTQIQRDTEVL